MSITLSDASPHFGQQRHLVEGMVVIVIFFMCLISAVEAETNVSRWCL